MNPKQRLMAALKHQPVDRMPVMTYNFHPFNGQWQRDSDKSWSGSPAYQPMMDVVWENEVGMLCKVSGSRTSAQQGRIRREQFQEDASTVTVTYLETPEGLLRSRHKKPPNQPGYDIERLIKDDGDIAKYLSMSNEPASIDLSPAKATYEALGNRGLCYLHYDDPMYAVARLFHFEDFCMRCTTQRSVIVEMIEREFERTQAELVQILEQTKGYDFLFYTAGPEVATPPMLSPDTFSELVTPYERHLVNMIHEAGHLCAIHCHGRVNLVLDEFLSIGSDALEPLEPPPQGDISLQEALARVDGRMCLMGYIQDQDLYTAHPGEMRDKVRAIRDMVDGRTGYIMTSSATPYMHPPPSQFVRNYVEYVRAASDG
jgi:hypothetical protein